MSVSLPLVLALGDGDQAVGFRRTMMGFAIIGTIFFIITFLTTKERIVPTAEQKSTVKQDLVAELASGSHLLSLRPASAHRATHPGSPSA